MDKSIATVHNGIPLIDVDSDELVVDEKKTKGIKMFRLAESNNAVLIHESLRDALLEKGFGSDIAFYDLKEAAILATAYHLESLHLSLFTGLQLGNSAETRNFYKVMLTFYKVILKSYKIMLKTYKVLLKISFYKTTSAKFPLSSNQIFLSPALFFASIISIIW